MADNFLTELSATNVRYSSDPQGIKRDLALTTVMCAKSIPFGEGGRPQAGSGRDVLFPSINPNISGIVRILRDEPGDMFLRIALERILLTQQVEADLHRQFPQRLRQLV